MSYQPPTAPMDAGSSPAGKPKKKRGCLGCGLLALGVLVALFIGAAVIAGISGTSTPDEDPDPTPTASASVSPGVVVSPEESVVAPPEPEPEPVAPEPVAPEPVAPVVAPYPNCEAVRAEGAAPIFPGDPGWNPRLDADKDGQACGDDV